MCQDEKDMVRYQILTDEIRSVKNQQWQIAYYVIVLFSALIGYRVLVSDYISSSNKVFDSMLCWSRSLALIIPIVGGILIALYAVKLKEYRTIKDSLEDNHFKSSSKKQALDAACAKWENVGEKIKCLFEIFFYIIIGFSFFVTAILTIKFITNCI